MKVWKRMIDSLCWASSLAILSVATLIPRNFFSHAFVKKAHRFTHEGRFNRKKRKTKREYLSAAAPLYGIVCSLCRCEAMWLRPTEEDADQADIVAERGCKATTHASVVIRKRSHELRNQRGPSRIQIW